MFKILYRKAIELKPNFAHPYCDSAVIYEKQDLYEKALEYYKMTLQLQPDHLNALINMSLLKQKIGQFDDIVDIFNRILRIDESNAFDIHMNIANILHKEIGNLNDALCHYEKALTYDNTSVEVYVRMGNICIELNMSKKALSYFHMAIQLDAQCLEAFINVGAIQKDSDNFIDAIHAYEATLKLKPDFPEVYCNLVICLLKVCDWSKYDSHMLKLKEILNKQLDGGQVLSLLPHDTLLLPLSFEVQKVVAEKYAQHCIEKLKKSIKELQQFVYPTSLASSNGNLRIGFVLTNFSKHPKTAILESLSSLKDYQIDYFIIISSDQTLQQRKLYSTVASELKLLRDAGESNLFIKFVNNCPTIYKNGDSPSYIGDKYSSLIIGAVYIPSASNIKSNLALLDWNGIFNGLDINSACKAKRKLTQNSITCNPKSFWRYVKSKRSTHSLPNSMYYNNNNISGSDNITNCFAQYFSSVLNTASAPQIFSDSYNVNSLSVDLNSKRIVSSMLGFISQSYNNFNNSATLKSLYCTFVRSILDYNSIIWSSYASGPINSLEVIQNPFLRLTSNKCKIERLPRTSYKPLLLYLNLDTLQVSRLKQDVCFFLVILLDSLTLFMCHSNVLYMNDETYKLISSELLLFHPLVLLNLFSDFKKHKDLSHLKVIDAAKLINNDGIHILVDMCGYTKDSQTELFALRPAPIQVSWLGYRNTSGAPFMDYLITDKVCSPPEFKNLYTEKLAFLNQTVFVGDHKQKFPNLYQLSAVDNTNNISYQNLNGNNSNEIRLAETIYIDEEPVLSHSRSQYNLPENAVVFCNFIPNSVLWLLHLNDDAENNLKKYADNFNNGCFDSSRIIFADFIPKCEHLKRIQLANIYLDTCLYNGHTASLDALWAEVPVVTLPGETYASRITASQLTTSGVTDTIAKNDIQYIDIAIKLCSNRQFLEHYVE
ncbi:UDP-N-acetylglucosamine--peptide N-acetylglucosaminyltransferase 110 kDa subunit-like, partial [Aphis craccivora]